MKLRILSQCIELYNNNIFKYEEAKNLKLDICLAFFILAIYLKFNTKVQLPSPSPPNAYMPHYD